DRDKARVLDGLESASDTAFDRGEMDKLLSSLTSRVFVMRNVHDDKVTLFQSRWALSYLRGPLSRDEIKRLAGGAKPTPAAAPSPTTSTAASPVAPQASSAATSAGARPVLPPGIPQYFSPEAAAAVTAPLRPVIYGAANVRFTDPKWRVDTTKLVNLTHSVADSAVPVDWENASRVEWAPEMLERDPPDAARFATLPSAASKPKNYDAWTKQLLASLCTTEAIDLFRSPSTGELSRPDESER